MRKTKFSHFEGTSGPENQIFYILVDVGPENGATEFCLGSHFHTKNFPDDIVWQDDR